MVRFSYSAALFALGLALASPALATEPLLNPGETLLEVQATGEASAAPDYGQMSIGVVSTGTTARAATDANAATMATVIAAIRKAGVDVGALRTEQINVTPRFARADANDYEGRAQITGYVARNLVGVTLTRLAIAPDVIAAAFGVGANSANGPALQIRNDAEVLAVARRDAVAKARAEAETYAESLGMKIGRVLRVSERGREGRSDIFVSANCVASYASASPPPIPPPLTPGRIRQTISLWVDYALVPK